MDAAFAAQEENGDYMKIDIEIPDEKTNTLSDQARSTLLKVGSKFLNEILDESERLAIARNTSNTDPEITASIVTDAEVYHRKYRSGRRPKREIIIVQIVAFVFSLIAGGLFDTSKFTDLVYFLLFFGSFIVATITGVVSILLGVKND